MYRLYIYIYTHIIHSNWPQTSAIPRYTEEGRITATKYTEQRPAAESSFSSSHRNKASRHEEAFQSGSSYPDKKQQLTCPDTFNVSFALLRFHGFHWELKHASTTTQQR